MLALWTISHLEMSNFIQFRDPQPKKHKKHKKRKKRIQIRGPKIGKADGRVQVDLLHKPFVGGYIDKTTRRRYHNAGQQHPFRPRHKERKLCRNTQTVKTANFRQQTHRECPTQMDRADLLLSHSADRDIDIPCKETRAEPYVDSKQTKKSRIESALRIQCALRTHFSKKKRSSLKSTKTARQHETQTKLEKATKAQEQQRRIRQHKKENPQHAYQFRHITDSMTAHNNQKMTDLLHNESISEGARSKIKVKMMHSHNKQLRNLQRRQLSTQKQHTSQRRRNMLQLMTSPKTWIMSDGRPVSVRTPTTHRAEQLVFIYNALQDNSLSSEHRLHLLATVARLIRNDLNPDAVSFDVKRDIEEIYKLMERERDMINRNRPRKSLRGVRARLLSKYYTLLLCADFNPEAARFSATPRYVSKKVKPRLVSKAYRKGNVAKRKCAVTPDTKTHVKFQDDASCL